MRVATISAAAISAAAISAAAISAAAITDARAIRINHIVVVVIEFLN